jgi:hypothetical protein
MRLGVFAFFAALWVCVTPAAAQSSITLDASPVPIVDAEINGRAVRLEVDLRLSGALALSQSAAERLRVRRVPFVAIRVGVEGSDSYLRGRAARPRIVFEGGDSRAFAGIFPAPVTVRADGVVGPGALPYDIVTVRLGPDQPGARDMSFTLEDADNWTPRIEVGGREIEINFDVTKQATVFNRPAVRYFDGTGAIPAAGDLAEIQVILGLRTLMQPVTTELTVAGLPLSPAFARTNAALLGADEPDAVIVEADNGDETPPRITLGRAALSRCSSISVDRRSKRLTLRCAA